MAKEITPEVMDRIVGEYGEISRYWLNSLLGMEKKEVAIIKASGKVIESPYLDIIVSDFQVLYNKLKLAPALAIGGGRQYDQACKDSYKVNDIRVTSKKTLKKVVRAAIGNLDSVVNALIKGGVEAKAMPFSIFKVERHGKEIGPDGKEIDVGYVGDIVEVDTAPIFAAQDANIVPVIAPIGVDESGQKYNVHGMAATAASAKSLGVYKVISLSDKSLEDKAGQIITEIKSRSHLNQILREKIATQGMAANLLGYYNLVMEMGPGRSVQLATPTNLMAELLTDGAGTIIRKPFNIQLYERPEHFGSKWEETLTKMVNDAFAKRGLVLADGYWSNHLMDRLFIDEAKTGGAEVRYLDGVPYMCMLFKHPDYQGNGLATQLMERVYSHYGGFMWRTALDEKNESIGFYKHFVDKFKANGLQKEGRFTGYKRVGKYLVFGVNVESKKKDDHFEKIASLPPNFKAAA